MRRVIMPGMSVLWRHGGGNCQMDGVFSRTKAVDAVRIRARSEQVARGSEHGMSRSRLEMKLTWGQCLSSATLR